MSFSVSLRIRVKMGLIIGGEYVTRSVSFESFPGLPLEEYLANGK